MRAAQVGSSCHEAIHVLRVRDVAADALAASARCGDLLGGAARARLVDVGTEREGAGDTETQRDGAADAGARTRDDRNLSVHPHLASLLRTSLLPGCLY
jgi:hypothetical protein